MFDQDLMEEIEQLEKAIAALEAQRAVLGSAVTDTALAPLQEKLAALKQAPLDEQRKMVTVLFADLVGFTAMAEKMEPEDVREVLEAYFARWTAAIQRYDGMIEKFIGDAVMVVYGLAAAQEDDAERAICTGLEVRDELETLNRELEAAYGLRLALRIGIHTGLAVVSVLGDGQGGDFVAVGDTINLASRLQAAAPENGILISHDAYRQVQGAFDVRPLEPFKVKGKEKPVQTYLVLQVKPRAFRMATRGVEGVETQMVGRQPELQRLQAEFSQVLEKRLCRVVTLLGEAGIGKSRLLYEFDNWLELHPQRLYYFRGRAFPSTQIAPYSLLRYLFAFRFQIHDSDTSQVVREKLERGLGAVLGGDDEGRMKAHVIGYVLGFSFEDSPYLEEAGSDARQYHQRALLYLRDYFRALAGQVPVVVLLEDIHWADHSSLDMLQNMAYGLASQPVLIVCAARPSLLERRPGWGDGIENYTRLVLAPLSKGDSRQLVGEILKLARDLPEYLGELVVDNADGNPFYIEELIKMLIEDGVIQKGKDHWQIRPERLEEMRVPPTLSGVLQARFDGLSREERRLLQRASVLGRTFWDRAVEYLSLPAGGESAEKARPAAAKAQPAADRAQPAADRAQPAADRAQPAAERAQPAAETLAALRQREMVFRRSDSSFDGTSEYFFKHALLRDVTYQSLVKRQRWVYHGLAARWLESVTRRSRRPDEYSALIASHYEQANERENAAQWYRRAGEAAAAQYANAEAIHNLTSALKLIPKTGDAQRFDLLLAREKVFDRLGDRKRQEDDLKALATTAETLEDDLRRADVYLRRAALAFYVGDYVEMESVSRQALTLAQQSGDLVREAGCHLSLGRALIWQSKPNLAVEELEYALGQARRLRLASEAECLWNLAVVTNNLGKYERALEYAQQALALYQSSEDFSGLSAIYAQIGAIFSNQGDQEKAREHLLKALDMSQLIGHRFRVGVLLNNLATIAYEKGQYSEAIRFQQQSLEVEVEIDDKAGLAISHLNLGDIWRELGAYGQAQSEYDRALELVEAIDDRMTESLILSAVALWWVQTGAAERGLDIGRKSLALARQTEAPIYIAHAFSRLAAALEARGRLNEAETAYREALSLQERLNLHGRVMESLGGLARIARQRGDLQGALGLVDEIRTQLETRSLDGTDEPAKLYLTCYEILTRAGRASAAREILAAGVRMLQKRAESIDQPERRRSYLESVLENRELMKVWNEIHPE